MAPRGTWLCAHLSDPHVVTAGDGPVVAGLDTTATLEAAVATVNALDPRPDLVVLSGDIVNAGRGAQYERAATVLAGLVPPLRMVPGNHDDRDGLRRAFPDHDHLGTTGTIDWVVDGAVRVIGLDSLVPGSAAGDLHPDQLAFLDISLAVAPATPTIVVLHHPPFATGIDALDTIALAGPAALALAEVVGRHPQVERVVAGHTHRPVSRRFAGTIAATVPGVAHATLATFGPDAPARWVLEPPAITVYAWAPELGLVTHQLPVGTFPSGRAG